MSKLGYVTRSFIDTVNKIERKYGRKKAKTALDLVVSAVKYKASPNNYYYFGFPELSDAQRRTYVTHDMSEKLQKKYNKVIYQGIFQNKFIFYQLFKKLMGNRDCVLSSQMTRSEFDAFINKNKKFIEKPVDGAQGRGIHVYENISSDEANRLFESLKRQANGVVLESWITQHQEMSLLYPDSVNPLRIQSIYDGKNTNILCATITIGHGDKFANASSHAIFALIDIETGIVRTDGCDYDGNKYIKHPDTGIQFKGYQIPCWDEVCSLIDEAAKVVPQIGYVGWDVAISKDGPLLIEGNNDPGYVGYQLADFGLTQGMKSVYEKFL